MILPVHCGWGAAKGQFVQAAHGLSLHVLKWFGAVGWATYEEEGGEDRYALEVESLADLMDLSEWFDLMLSRDKYGPTEGTLRLYIDSKGGRFRQR